MRNWEFTEKHTITLDGQWEFYPRTFLMQSPSNRGSSNPGFIQVPGGWNAFLGEEKTPYGYGTYRLRILVNPDSTASYGIRISSIRSSTELFVNGQLLTQLGKPAALKGQYTPKDDPTSAFFELNGDNEIEVVIHAANYDDPRDSGIIRSMTFGTEAAVKHETRLSANMRIVVSIAYLIHAVYAFIVFLVGKRDRRLLYFSLMIVCGVFGILANGDSLLLDWFTVPYEWTFKLMPLAMIIGSYSLIQCIRHLLPEVLRVRIFPWYTVLCAITACIIVLMPARYGVRFEGLYLSVVTVSCLTSFVIILRRTLRRIDDSLFSLLALIAALASLGWSIALHVLELRLIYYPVDLIIAIITFSAIWIKRYFRIFGETEKLAAKLQMTDKLKDDFLANTSHELRNPLHGILNISQTVLEREKHSLNDKSAKDLEMILTVGRRMSFMLNDLLDMMRLKENGILLQTTSLSVHTVASGVLDMLRFMTDGKSIRLTNHIPNSFPHVIADENRLIQILFNLLHNAVKYTLEGEVAIRAYVRGGKAHIKVTDTGIGMDEEMLGRVFEPYEQATPGLTSIGGGFGLGLSICKQLVELHGGTLVVSSTPGQGATFTFTLELSEKAAQQEDGLPKIPLLRYEESAAGIEGVSPEVSVATNNAAGADRVRILAVDDDPINLRVLENVFSSEGVYEVVKAASGAEALSMLDTGQWDLVIADVMMPYMSGYELTRSIRERFTISELPVLLLTARARLEDIETGFLAGASDYVTKPMAAMELRSRVRALTDLKRSVNEQLRMEAAWLQAQIKPHFILNTFNIVAALSEIDTSRMIILVEEFGNYLRGSIDCQNSELLAPLEHELNLLRAYLYIEKERFGDRLQIVWEVDESVQVEIPPLSIQPLVENAVKHGILKRSRGGQIRIRIVDSGEDVEIAIVDNGVGIEKDMLGHLLDRQSTKRTGIGLLNIDRRLKKLYGKGLQIDSEPGKGTTVSFVIRK